MVTLQMQQIEVLPGQRLVLHHVDWQQFEAILAELGDSRGSRVAYSQGILEIVAPLPEHESAKVIVGDLVKILLEELEVDCESYGSTTFKRESMGKGIEPDDSFYIANHQQMIGRSRIDLSVDPPPDLAIELCSCFANEIDLTSKTQLEAYEGLGVPELWRLENRRLRIDVLVNGKYVQSASSPTFPDLPIAQAITEFVEQAQSIGRSPALRAFRAWVRQHL